MDHRTATITKVIRDADWYHEREGAKTVDYLFLDSGDAPIVDGSWVGKFTAGQHVRIAYAWSNRVDEHVTFSITAD